MAYSGERLFLTTSHQHILSGSNLVTFHHILHLLTQIPLGLKEDLFSFFLCFEQLLVCKGFVTLLSWPKELLSPLLRLEAASSSRGDNGGGNSFSSLFLVTFLTELFLPRNKEKPFATTRTSSIQTQDGPCQFLPVCYVSL